MASAIALKLATAPRAVQCVSWARFPTCALAPQHRPKVHGLDASVRQCAQEKVLLGHLPIGIEAITRRTPRLAKTSFIPASISEVSITC